MNFKKWVKSIQTAGYNGAHTVFKFSVQDSDLEYLFWRRKNSPVSSDLKPPLKVANIQTRFKSFWGSHYLEDVYLRHELFARETNWPKIIAISRDNTWLE